MKKNKIILAMSLITCLTLGGCASLTQKLSLDADQTTHNFFMALQRSNHQQAYDMFGKGLSQNFSYDQFNQFMITLKEHFGRVVGEETVEMPFHHRIGEDNFIPLKAEPSQIKRYTFAVDYDNAQINFDLTLFKDVDAYKIIWFSVWGDGKYMTSEINNKIQELFGSPVQQAGQLDR